MLAAERLRPVSYGGGFWGSGQFVQHVPRMPAWMELWGNLETNLKTDALSCWTSSRPRPQTQSILTSNASALWSKRSSLPNTQQPARWRAKERYSLHLSEVKLISAPQHTIFQYRKSSSRRLFKGEKNQWWNKRGNPHSSLSRKSSMPARSRLFQKYLVESPIYLMTQRERDGGQETQRGKMVLLDCKNK